MIKLILLVALLAGCVTASKPTPVPTCPTAEKYCYHDAHLLKRKLFVAILWRDIPAEEASQPDGQRDMIQRGQLRELALGMLDSPEFHEQIAPKPYAEVITQFYRGLIGREPAGGTIAAEAPFRDALLKVIDSDEFKEKELLEPLLPAVPEPTPTPAPEYSKRTGLVKRCDHALCDEQGPFQALGATMFHAARLYRYDKEKLERNLKTLAENKFDYFRALGTVAWAEREIDPKWSDYEETIRGVTDLAYDKYGLRVQWTIFGDAQKIVPSAEERRKVVEMFLRIANEKPHKVILLEVANEYYQNGFSGDEGIKQIRSFAKLLRDGSDVLVAVSAPRGGVDGEREALYGGSVADVLTFHTERAVFSPDNYWRPVRQPWGEPNFDGVLGSNNEPIGPGSSVNCDQEPLRLIAQAVVTSISKVPFYVFHSRAGVGSNSELCGLSGNMDLSQMPGIANMGIIKSYIPSDLSNWTKHNHYWPGNPFRVYGDGKQDHMTTDGAKSGCMRNHAAVRGNDFLVIPTGIKKTCEMEPKTDVEFDIIDLVTGEVIEHKQLKAGQRFGISGRESVLLKGQRK